MRSLLSVVQQLPHWMATFAARLSMVVAAMMVGQLGVGMLACFLDKSGVSPRTFRRPRVQRWRMLLADVIGMVSYTGPGVFMWSYHDPAWSYAAPKPLLPGFWTIAMLFLMDT